VVKPQLAWQHLLDEAEVALGEGRHADGLQLCDRAAQQDPEARYFACLLRGDILLDMDDAIGALSSYDSVADPAIPDPDVDCARGVALFELSRFPEAENALRSALRGNPELAEAHYTLGLIAELMGHGAAVEDFRQARRLDPERFPHVPQMPRAEFEGLVEEAVRTLPPKILNAIQGVPILVAEVPHPADLVACDPPLSPRILGIFVGPPPAAVSVLDPTPEQPPTILLFKRNLERVAPDYDALMHEVRITVLHEVGHALGLSEQELVAMGLE